MRIVCLGGGPAGLYFSILIKKANPAWEITVVERNRAGQHVRLGRGVFRQDHERLPAGRSGNARSDHAGVSALG